MGRLCGCDGHSGVLHGWRGRVNALDANPSFPLRKDHPAILGLPGRTATTSASTNMRCPSTVEVCTIARDVDLGAIGAGCQRAAADLASRLGFRGRKGRFFAAEVAQAAAGLQPKQPFLRLADAGLRIDAHLSHDRTDGVGDIGVLRPSRDCAKQRRQAGIVQRALTRRARRQAGRARW